MSADKPLSPEVAASPSAPETAGEHSDLNKTNETAAEPSLQGAAPADTPAEAAEASAASAPETTPEATPETQADGQPPLPPVPPVGTVQSPAAEPENLPIQSESTPPATPEDEVEEEADDRPMGLMDHLSELRGRLVRCCLAVMVGFIACWAVVDPIFDALVAPLLSVLPDGSHAIYTTLPEGFFTRMHIAFVAGVFVSSPAIFYQVWAFIAPGLYEEEKRSIIPVAVMSAFFFISGGAFCYFVVFPNAFAFFMSYATDTIVAMPKISDYLSFVLKLILAFGLVFEMPLFAFFLARMGIITAELMRRVRRYAILAIFIVAAILSPPDVVSQLLMAAPMLVLYEVSIFVAAGFGKKPAKEEDESDEKPEGEDGETPDAGTKPDKDENTSEKP
ncbi:Sec-independent protein translocase protein TatC [uncultured Desulfovibrio sp.]|uniref:Sec-independent protein translocase protein TatC n=1 Tax=uncultured Desulfovibrio sp. TaxID=167968 RepID=A0A212K9C8_9BACT|nr:twin-arginine translocase subunit TatC [Desulfovibrio desulfuricans]MCB6542407.1 twin-arginine translocase subunit TatC [Desulfovibrio desulfuricans]MCB6553383.1 twin-arginine translocase subunit TatC [Desulfovibrio desulfuricans]MCB6565451.1 twin-arginine translocase subunit TatC [Desulfovibrio desulfuricans]MCB7346800.1 twin-arginine translocase subunit TatC [Desulfovibrio desulfuricans]MCQ5217705.1 twin-arginine translocase subunit TatC [Desulfovibrio desulfuricans]